MEMGPRTAIAFRRINYSSFAKTINGDAEKVRKKEANETMSSLGR